MNRIVPQAGVLLLGVTILAVGLRPRHDAPAPAVPAPPARPPEPAAAPPPIAPPPTTHRDPIETLRRDPSPMARATAAYLLMKPSEPASAALRSQLAVERDADTRRAVIIALGRQRDAAAADALLAVLADPAQRAHWLDAAAGLRHAPADRVPRMQAMRGRMDDPEIAEQLDLSLKCALGVATIADFERPPDEP